MNNYFQLALIIPIVLIGFNSRVLASCNFEGVKLIRAERTHAQYDSLSAALATAKVGDRLEVGGLDKLEETTISKKDGLTLTSACKGKIGRLTIESSKDLIIENLEIAAKNGAGIRFADGDIANTNIALRHIRIFSEFLGTNGIVLGKNNRQIAIDDITIEDFLDEGMLVAAGNSGIVMSNSIIKQSGNSGVIINETSDVSMTGMVITGNGSSFVTTGKNAFGLVIQRSSQSASKNVRVSDSKIYFNLGSLDTQFDSDIDATGTARFERVQTTTGVEGAGVSKWDGASVFLNGQRITDYLSKQPDSVKKFLAYYIQIEALAIAEESFGAADFAFIREYQLDQCASLKLGDTLKDALIGAVHAAIGNRPEHLQKYLFRHKDADQSLIAPAYPGFCDSFY
ncbi:MAG: hypothetical protein EOP10_01580 [Proteobacteria bacterium]|nr:MAG: hypothetical protein EOP10_01580 [Pseudomonadota bacterium]